MQTRHVKKVARGSVKGHKAVIPDKHKLARSESHVLRQSEKDIAEGKYGKYSSVEELLEAIKNDKL